MPQLPGVSKSQPVRAAPILPGAGSNVYDEAQGLWGLPSPTGEVVSATAEETAVRNPVPSIERFFGRIETERGVAAERRDRLSPLDYSTELPEAPVQLSPEEANKRFGVDFYGKSVLSWDAPVREDTAQELYDLKIGELRRETILSRAGGGVGQNLARFGTGLAVSAIDPLNIASAFIPVFGEARYVQLLTGASGAFGRAGVRAGVGAVEGVAGAAIVEPIIYGVAQSEQADYGLTDSFLNIVFGGVLGGGLHTSFGAIGDRLGTSSYAREIDALRAERGTGPIEAMPDIQSRPDAPQSRFAEAVNDLSPEVRDDLLRASVAEMAQNGEVRATGALAESVGLGVPLRGEAGWRFTEADIDALRVSQPEIVARSDAAMARLAEVEGRAAELRQQLDSQTEADAVARIDDLSGERIRAIDEELSGTIPAARREQLEGERAGIIETLGRENIERVAREISIGPGRKARDAERGVAAARKEARRANRELQVALSGRQNPMEAISEAFKSEPAPEVTARAETSPSEAARELKDMEVRLAAMDAISPLSPEARAALDEADMLIERSNNEAQALEIALACATRN